MKISRRLISLALLILCCFVLTAQTNTKTKSKAKAKAKTKLKAKSGPCSEGEAYRNCLACGTAKSTNGQALNVLKNRGTKATAPHKMTVAQIQPGTEKTFNSDQQVWVTGYVASVVPGGNKEACNCNRTDLRDIHINIVSDPSEAKDQSKYVVVEFTPRWEKEFGLDDSQPDPQPAH
jgi:hypothetical protein